MCLLKNTAQRAKRGIFMKNGNESWDVLGDSRKRYRGPWAEIEKYWPGKEPIRLQGSLPCPLKKKLKNYGPHFVQIWNQQIRMREWVHTAGDVCEIDVEGWESWSTVFFAVLRFWMILFFYGFAVSYRPQCPPPWTLDFLLHGSPALYNLSLANGDRIFGQMKNCGKPWKGGGVWGIGLCFLLGSVYSQAL